jgi:hypothetical protein
MNIKEIGFDVVDWISLAVAVGNGPSGSIKFVEFLK